MYTPSDTFVGTDRFTYSLVDAGGEFAIGEVLIGVMPAAGANRAPEAFDDDVASRRRQRAAGVRRAGQRLRPRRRHAQRDHGRHAVERWGRGRRRTAAPSCSRRRPTLAGATAAARRRVHLLDRRRPRRDGVGDGGRARHRGVASRSPRSPSTTWSGRSAPGSRSTSTCSRNDLDPDGDPTELVVSSTDPALVVKQPGTFTVTAGTTSGRHVYTVTDPAGLTDTAEVDVLVVPNRAPAVAPFTAQTTADQPIELDLTAQATDPDGDTLYFSCCDQPHGGVGDDARQRRRSAARDVHPRRRVQRAGDVRLRRRRPAGPHRRRCGGHRRARPVQPPARGHGHHARRRRRHPDEHRPRRRW